MSQPQSIADLRLLAGRKDKLRTVNKDIIADILLKDTVSDDDDDDVELSVAQMLKNCQKK
jgi:hypothetical protein